MPGQKEGKKKSALPWQGLFEKKNLFWSVLSGDRAKRGLDWQLRVLASMSPGFKGSGSLWNAEWVTGSLSFPFSFTATFGK